MGSARRLKSWVLIAAALALALALAGCASGQGESGGAPAGNADLSKLAIIHTNDTHGYDQAADGCLGMAAVAQLKADYQAKGYDVLLFDAGDALQGNLLVDDSEGGVVPSFMNACGYDAFVPGNHEFDNGADVLQKCIEEFEFPTLCANITVDATGESFARDNVVFTLSNGAKVGVFGLDTPESMTKTDPKNVAGLTFAAGDELYACAQGQIDALSGQGCDLIVCVGHLGEEETSAPNRASDVVAHTSGLDLFIDGHDHAVENALIKDASGDDVLVVETGCHLANIGVVTCEDGALVETLVAAGDYTGSDPEVAKLIDSVAADINARMQVVAGTSPFELNGQRMPGLRDRETNLGDFAADALMWQAEHALGVRPDAAVVNGGSLRTSVAAGDVTLGELHDVYPFSNMVFTIEVTGAQLLEALEAACQGSPDEMGAFPQVSGIVYTLDVTVPFEKGELYPASTFYKPANPGARVHIESVNGKPFDPDATYRIATTDFIAHGGDTYYCFAEAAHKSQQSTGYVVFEALKYYLTDGCGGAVPDVYAQPQGRITVIGQ